MRDEDPQQIFVANLDAGMASVSLFKNGDVKISLDDSWVRMPLQEWLKIAQDRWRMPNNANVADELSNRSQI